MDFDFDCPMITDLSSIDTGGVSDPSWFFKSHPGHEKSMITESMNPDSCKLDKNEFSTKDIPNEPQVKTAVPIVMFTKKRPLTKTNSSASSKRSSKSFEKENLHGNHTCTIASNSRISQLSKPKSNTRALAASSLRAKPASSTKPIPCRTQSSRGATSKPTANSKLQQKKDKTDEKEMLEMLKRHNEKFAPASLYEPPKHSVRDIRKWERHSGQVWSDLKPDQRGAVNEEIFEMKKNRVGPFCPE